MFFSPSLFPAIDPEALPLREAARESGLLDQTFGIPVEAAETAFSARAAADEDPFAKAQWVDLPAHALLTPYSEISFLLDLLRLKPGDRVIELGSGYARMALVLAAKAADVDYVGYECVPERFFASYTLLRRLGLPRARVLFEDLNRAAPGEGSHYFLYDFGSAEAVAATLNRLREIARDHPIQVIARGRRSRDIIERGHPWLSQVHPPRHFKNFSIYFS